MSINSNTLTFGTYLGVKNVTAQPSAGVKKRKVLLVGTGDASKGFTENESFLVTSDADVGVKTGFGFALHALSKYWFANNAGVETYIILQPEDGSATTAEGTITFTATALTENKIIYLYIGGELITSFVGAVGDDGDALATKCAAAITATVDSYVLAVVDGTITNQVNLTAKSAGTFGNFISVEFNINGEEYPDGLTSAVVVDMTGGATDGDLDDAFNSLGTGDAQNGDDFTDVVCSYEKTQTNVRKSSSYNGAGNTYVGNYAKTVKKPFRMMWGDNVSGSSGLTTLISFVDNEKTDRTNGVVAVPDSTSHPVFIAGASMGVMANTNSLRAEENYLDKPLVGIVGSSTPANRWSDEQSNRQSAVERGISPTLIKNNAVVLQNVCSFYHPDDVPLKNNGYLSMRNISITQNVLNAEQERFDVDEWKGITIVDDATTVADPDSAEKVKDVAMMRSAWIGLYDDFQDRAWIYSSAYSKGKIAEDGKVTVRDNAFSGFDVLSELIYSKEGGLLNVDTYFDVSIAVLS